MQKLLDTYREAFRGLPRTVWTLAVISLINRAGTMVLPFLSIYLKKHEGLETADVGFLIAVYGGGAGLGVLVAGRITDRTSPRAVMSGSLGLSALFLVALCYAHGMVAIGVTLFLLSAVGEAFRPANGAAIARVCPPERLGQAYGLVRLAVNAGMTIGPALGGFLAARRFATLFWVDAATCLAASVVAFATLHVVDREDTTQDEEEPEGPTPLRDGPFLRFLFGIFASSVLFFIVFSAWPLYHREVYGFPTEAIGLLFAVNTVVIIVFEMVLVHRIRGRDKLRILGVGAGLLGLGLGVLPLLLPLMTGVPDALSGFRETAGFLASPPFLLASAAVVIWTVGEMLIGPTAAAWVADRAPKKRTGAYMGWFNFSFAVGHLVGPWAALAVYADPGPDVLWYGCLALGFLLVGYFKWLSRTAQGSTGRAGRMPP